jgi:hypothetical protein
MQPDNLDKLETIVQLLSDSVSKKDFTDAVDQLAAYVQDIKKTNDTEWTMVHTAFQMLQQKIEKHAQPYLDSVKQEIQDTHQSALSALHQKVDTKLATLKHGTDGLDGQDGLDGADATAPTKEELIALIKPLVAPHIEKLAKTLQTSSADTRTPGWGAHPLGVQQSGTTKTKLARMINFTGATVTQSSQGVTTVAISGGTGYQAATGTVDGSNTIFTFTSAPSALSVDGIIKQKTASDGTANWTGTTTITLAVAPNFDIFAVA